MLLQGCEEFCTLELMVENLGRANFGSPHNFEQKKGLWEGDVLLDGRVLDDWEHISVEPTGPWLDQLQGWREYSRWLRPILSFATFPLQTGARSFRTKDTQIRIWNHRFANNISLSLSRIQSISFVLQKIPQQTHSLIMTALRACKSYLKRFFKDWSKSQFYW